MPESEPDQPGSTRKPRPDSGHRRPGARQLWAAVAALALGSAALWGASRIAWSAELREEGVRGAVLHIATGGERAALLTPFALLAVAGIAGVVAARGVLRRVLGGVLVLAGLVPSWEAVRTVRFTGLPEGAPVAQMLAGHGLALVGGLLIAAAGALALVAGARMPALGARYSAPAAGKPAPDPDRGLWDALSEGDDPTRGG